MSHEEPLPDHQPSGNNLKDCGRVLEEALSLPADSRLVLIEQLQESLNLPIQDDIDRLWREEAERRVAQIARGEVELVSGEEVFAKIRERYNR